VRASGFPAGQKFVVFLIQTYTLAARSDPPVMTPEPKTPATTDTGSTPAATLDFSETFPHLQKAPVVEAVLDFRAPAAVALDQATMQAQLAAQLPDYPKILGQRMVESTFKSEAGKSPEASARDLGWVGFDCRTADEKQVAQFHKDGFAFSRLDPYQNWELFTQEALRLWRLHLELAQPEEIKRIGVRFINRMLFPVQGGKANLKNYLTTPPVNPKGLELPMVNFLHQELRTIPSTVYALNLTKIMQPVERSASQLALILDVDVFTAVPLRPNDPSLGEHLNKMRWLKNKAFFASVTAKAIETFQ
jgi:uncharacterized protein (TIGR04255 family)